MTHKELYISYLPLSPISMPFNAISNKHFFFRLELYMLLFKLVQKYKFSYDGPAIGINYFGNFNEQYYSASLSNFKFSVFLFFLFCISLPNYLSIFLSFFLCFYLSVFLSFYFFPSSFLYFYLSVFFFYLTIFLTCYVYLVLSC